MTPPRQAGLILAALLFCAAGASAQARGSHDARPFRSVRLAITIDDFPENGKLVEGWTRRSVVEADIATLKKHQLRGVYGFALGSFAPAHPEEQAVLAAWLAAGNRLGNHTFDHPHLNSVSAEAEIAEIEHEDSLLATLGGQTVSQRRVFRYPYLDEGDSLAKRDAVRGFLFAHGYRIAEVTTNYDDWDWGSAYARCSLSGDEASIASLKHQVIAAADARLAASVRLSRRLYHRDTPQILLIHLGPFTALTLDSILTRWSTEGVKIISLDQALSDRIFRFNPNVPDECAACVGSHGRPFLEQVAISRHIDPGPYQDRQFPLARIDQVCAGPPGA